MGWISAFLRKLAVKRAWRASNEAEKPYAMGDRMMMNTTILQLHERAVIAVKQYLTAESELIEVLMELDERRGYRDFGQSSLKEYAIKTLGLSEDPAETLIRIAHKSSDMPRLLALMKSGESSI